MRTMPKVYVWMGLCMVLILACNFLSFSEEGNPSPSSMATSQEPASPVPEDTGQVEATPEITETVFEDQTEESQTIDWEQPVYADDFVDIYSGWPNDPGGAFGYPEAFEACANPSGNTRFPCEANPETQVYQMNIDGNTTPPIYVSALEEYEYGPVGMEIDTTVLENTLGHAFYGFVCHYRDPGNYNALIVSTKGHTGIFKMLDGKSIYLAPSGLNTDFLAFMLAAQADGVPITLRAECNADALILSTGGSVISEAGGGIAEAGLNGLIAGVEKEAEQGIFSIDFDNYKVYKP